MPSGSTSWTYFLAGSAEKLVCGCKQINVQTKPEILKRSFSAFKVSSALRIFYRWSPNRVIFFSCSILMQNPFNEAPHGVSLEHIIKEEWYMKPNYKIWRWICLWMAMFTEFQDHRLDLALAINCEVMGCPHNLMEILISMVSYRQMLPASAAELGCLYQKQTHLSAHHCSGTLGKPSKLRYLFFDVRGNVHLLPQTSMPGTH